jgi:hypothetical protein
MAEQEIVAGLTAAFESGDVEKLVSPLTEDVWVTMPPLPLEYQGREPAARFFSTVSFRPGRMIRYVATRANGQPALASYIRDPQTGLYPQWDRCADTVWEPCLSDYGIRQQRSADLWATAHVARIRSTDGEGS